MSKNSILADYGAHFVLTLRAERPIEGCELVPNAFLQIKGGNLDNSTRAKLLEANPYTFVFIWDRSPLVQLCGNGDNCPRVNDFEPQSWSKAALGGPELVCSVCEKGGVPIDESLFCSMSCFRNAWQFHALKHKNGFNLKPIPASNLDEQTVSDSDGDFDRDEKDSQLTLSSNASSSWVSVSNDKVYVPTKIDVGSRFRIQVKAVLNSDSSVVAGPITIFTPVALSAPIPPPKRSLLTIPNAGTGLSAAIRFRVISYNILAEIYATKQAFPYCDTWSLAWPYRKTLLLAELEEMQGDLVCLQEVQADHFEQHLQPFMNERGYDGIFKQKSREFMGQYGKVDGCATFWKRSKFIMTENYSVEFNDIARNEALEMGLDENDCRKYITRLSRDNIAQIIILECLSRSSNNNSRTCVCVVNTHLYANHLKPDVKLWQALSLMREIEQLVTSRDLALLMCGDFNSLADSEVYEFLTSGSISEQRYMDVFKNGSTFNILPAIENIGHNVELGSAMYAANGSEPLFTNYTSKFRGALDYIFYSPSKIRICAVSSIPNEIDLQMTCGEGLPSTCYPSDHLLLSCDVALLPNSTVSSMLSNNQSHHNNNSNKNSNNFNNRKHTT
eukprot:gene4098-5846_t